MDRNSFSLKSLAGNSPRQIPASASEAPKASQPSRLLFSSFERLDRLPNTGSSSEIANQISPGLLNDRARLNKPLSMLRFGAVHTNSSHSDDCMGTRKDSQDSRDHFDSGEIESSTDIANYPDTGRNARNATDNNITDINNTSQGIVTEGDAQYEEKDSQRQGHHPDPSFSCLEEILGK